MSNNVTSVPQRSPDPCSSVYAKWKYESFYYEVAFSISIIIAVLAPVAVAGNGLILAAIWKKTFARTPFHILLSGLAFADLCTGLIAQPFYAATILMFITNTTIVCDKPTYFISIVAITNGSETYFLSITVLLMTVMSIERWLHMSRRSLVTSRRGCLTVATVLLIPIPLVVVRLLVDINGTFRHEFLFTITTMILVCFFTMSTAYFSVFRIIRRHQQQVHESSQNFGQPAINLAKYKKSVASILYVLVLFSFCFLPLAVTIGVQRSLRNVNNSEVSVAYNVSLMLLLLSSSLNPGLYIWRMNDIRKGVRQLF